jgi:hypothetical protein
VDRWTGGFSLPPANFSDLPSDRPARARRVFALRVSQFHRRERARRRRYLSFPRCKDSARTDPPAFRRSQFAHPSSGFTGRHGPVSGCRDEVVSPNRQSTGIGSHFRRSRGPRLSFCRSGPFSAAPPDNTGRVITRAPADLRLCRSSRRADMRDGSASHPAGEIAGSSTRHASAEGRPPPPRVPLNCGNARLATITRGQTPATSA